MTSVIFRSAVAQKNHARVDESSSGDKGTEEDVRSAPGKTLISRRS